MPSEAEGRIVVPVWVDDDVVKALIDDDGYMPVTIKNWLATQDVNIVGSDITVPVYITSAMSSVLGYSHEYDGSTWRKAPINRGYRGVQREYIIQTSTAAGSLRCFSTPVPTGYIWVIEGYSFAISDPGGKNVTIGIWNGAANILVTAYQNVSAGIWYGAPMDLTIRQTEQFTIGYYASAAGVNCQVWYAARTIDVSM